MKYSEPKSIKQQVISYIMLLIGAFLAALSIEKFLLPNKIIDGGIVGVSILLDEITQINRYYFFLILNLPFVFLAYKYIAKRFIINMSFSLAAFVFLGHFIQDSSHTILQPYRGDLLEIVVRYTPVYPRGIQRTLVWNEGTLVCARILPHFLYLRRLRQ